MKTAIALGLAAVLGVAACGGAKPDATARKDTLTERQRDSALAKSGIPGSGAVGKAMRAADSTSSEVRGDTNQ